MIPWMAITNDKKLSDARWQAQGPKLLEPAIVVATERSQLNHIEICMNTHLSLKVTQLASFSGNNYITQYLSIVKHNMMPFGGREGGRGRGYSHCQEDESQNQL